MNHTYHTIENPSIAEFRDRGSRFIAFAFPIDTVPEFKTNLAELKKEHPKAVHHCFAYRIGSGNDVFRSSDDGEPSGTAGRPILGQIDSHNLTNVLVIVVRYFGGTLLGVPGLINAYKTVTADALNKCRIIERTVLINYRLEFDYTITNEVMRRIKQFDCKIKKQDMQLFCVMELGVPADKKEEFLGSVKNLVQLKIEEIF